MPQEEKMEQGRKGKMDLGMEEVDHRVFTQAGEWEALRKHEVWLYSLAFPQCPGVGRSAGWSCPAPIDGSAASQGRTVQGRWIKTAAAKGEERARFTSHC